MQAISTQKRFSERQSPPAHPHLCRVSAATPQESAADLGAKYAETTNRAVAKGLDYTVVATKSALVATGVVDASVAAVALADRAVEASGVVGLTRKAVAATGRALDATAAAAERVGAGDISARMTSVSATALGPVAAISSRALGASVDATVTAVDMTVNGTLKAVALTNRAAEALPQAADLFGCARRAGCAGSAGGVTRT